MPEDADLGDCSRLPALSAESTETPEYGVADRLTSRCGILSISPSRINGSSGFSLIEVLIGLAITSVVSALIFASLATQMTQADTVRRSTNASFETAMSIRLWRSVISATVPSWQDEEAEKFQGSKEAASGTFVNALFGSSDGLQGYAVALNARGQERWLEIRVGEEQWQVGRVPLNAEFRYLGQSGAWRTFWPPLPASSANSQDFQNYIQDYGLPVMMCVWDTEENRPLGFEVRFENSGVLPARTRDLIGLP